MFFDTLSFEGSEIICIAMFLIVEEEGELRGSRTSRRYPMTFPLIDNEYVPALWSHS
jgi:hypothetical protein